MRRSPLPVQGPLRPLSDEEALQLYEVALPGFLDSDTDDEERGRIANHVRAIVDAPSLADATELVWERFRLCADYSIDRSIARQLRHGAQRLGAFLSGGAPKEDVDRDRLLLDEHNARFA